MPGKPPTAGRSNDTGALRIRLFGVDLVGGEQTLRWWLTTKLLWWGLKLAPDGSAACSLEDHLNEWAQDCRKAWAARYPAMPPGDWKQDGESGW